MKKWGISLLGEMPHFIILVILFAANLLNGRIEGRIGYRSILAVINALNGSHLRIASSHSSLLFEAQ